jgi:hypothetical protein
MSAIRLEVLRRLNDPAFGETKQAKQEKPRRERVKPVSIMEAEMVPEPKPQKVPSPQKTEQVNEVERFVWDRSKTIALASPRCAQCVGIGLRRGRSGEEQPCGCVLRSAARAVLSKYRYIQAYQDRVSSCAPVVMQHGRERKRAWARKNEEFCADVYLVSKRSLQGQEWKIFELHMLNGNDWRYCTRILGMDRGNFFHSVYRIQQNLGRIFMELQPYALFPIDEYFGGMRSEKTFVGEDICL